VVEGGHSEYGDKFINFFLNMGLSGLHPLVYTIKAQLSHGSFHNLVSFSLEFRDMRDYSRGNTFIYKFYKLSKSNLKSSINKITKLLGSLPFLI
jgi:hypothetical protein